MTAAAADRSPSAACPASSATRCASGDVAQYATLPAGLVTGINDFTVSVWVNPVANQTWSRVFDFGTGTTQNMFLTVNAGGAGVRYAITTGGGGAEQRITYNGTLPLNQWSHVAVTLSGTTGTAVPQRRRRWPRTRT